jgi:hypothetical protein
MCVGGAISGTGLEFVELPEPTVVVLHGTIVQLRSPSGDCALRLSRSKYPVK